MNDWWKKTIFYEIYIPSFNDSNGDGKGDFKGIIKKLDYLKELGITGIWLTPFYKSPKVDNGYDISDYYSIDEDYGTMEDFNLLIKKAHEIGIKVITDLVLNHTSTQHKWFLEAKKSKGNKYRDYYIWAKNKNNWESFFGGSAWELDENTKEYYYHKFAKEQVDLNWTNPNVLKESKKIIKFWMNKGIDGFRLDVINFMSCHNTKKNNPLDLNKEQKHKYDINQPGILKIIKEINKCVKSYGNKFLVGEVGSDNLNVLKRYVNKDLLDVVFNFNLGSKESFDSNKFFYEIDMMEQKLKGYPTIFFGSHDMPRLINRFGDKNYDKDRAKAIAALTLTTKGVPFIYYGDEIGMTNLIAKNIDDIVDVQAKMIYKKEIKKCNSALSALEAANSKNRDKSRSPMQWNNLKNSGFTSGKPWLKVNENYKDINVEKQKKETKSLFHYYKKLITLRKNEKILSYGEYQNLSYSDGLLTFERILKEEKIYVYINFDKEKEIELPKGNFEILIGKINNKLIKNEVLIIKGGKK